MSTPGNASTPSNIRQGAPAAQSPVIPSATTTEAPTQLVTPTFEPRAREGLSSVFEWLTRLGKSTDVMKRSQVFPSERVQMSSDGLNVHKTIQDRVINPAALSVWNVLASPSGSSLILPAGLHPSAKKRSSLPAKERKGGRWPVLLPFEGILLSLLLNHSPEGDDNDNGRHDVALAVRFAWSLAQPPAVQKLCFSVWENSSVVGFERSITGRASNCQYISMTIPSTFIGVALQRHLATTTLGTYDASMLCELGSLLPQRLWCTTPFEETPSAPSLARAIVGCLYGEQVDICKILLLCLRGNERNTWSNELNISLPDFVQQCPLFHPPDVARPKPFHPRLDIDRWQKVGVDVVALLRPAFESSFAWDYHPASDVVFNLAVFEAALPSIDPQILYGDFLVPAFHSVRTTVACLSKCMELPPDLVLGVVRTALTQRSPVTSVEVLECLWDALGESVVNQWTADDRKGLLQSAALSGQVATIDFALNAMNIPLWESMAQRYSMSSSPFVRPSGSSSFVSRFRENRWRISPNALIPFDSFLSGTELPRWNDVEFHCFERFQAHVGPADPPLFESKMLFLCCCGTEGVSDFARFLVENQAVDINCRVATTGGTQVTPLQVAAVERNLGLVKYLFERGAKVESSIFFDLVGPHELGDMAVIDGINSSSHRKKDPQETLLLLDFLISTVGLDPPLARDPHGNSLLACRSLFLEPPDSLGFFLPYFDLGEIDTDEHIPLTRWLGTDSKLWLKRNMRGLMGYQQSWNPHWRHPNGTGLDLLHIAILLEDFTTLTLACHHLGLEFLKKQQCVTLLGKGMERGDSFPDSNICGWNPRPQQAQQSSLLERVLSIGSEAAPTITTTTTTTDGGGSGSSCLTPIELARSIGQESMARYMENLLGVR